MPYANDTTNTNWKRVEEEDRGKESLPFASSVNTESQIISLRAGNHTYLDKGIRKT